MKPIFKTIACAVAVLVLLQSTIYAGNAAQITSPTGPLHEAVRIEIPDDLASIVQVYESKDSEKPQVIVHIQNIHGNYQAQKQIDKLLQYLIERYGFEVMFLEGASEQLNPKFLRLFKSESENAELAEIMLKQGRITGPEYFLLQHKNQIQALGIEHPELYRMNYRLFKKVMEAKQETDAYVQGLDLSVQNLASRIFPAETRRILSESLKFRQGHREFLPYLRQLSKDSKKHLGIDLESLFAQLEWPQMSRMLTLQALESEMNRDRALREKAMLVEFLRQKKVDEELIRDVGLMGEEATTFTRLLPYDASRQAAARNLLERLHEKAAPLGFRFQDYPEFSRLAGYWTLHSEINFSDLFKEIELLFDKLLFKLAPLDSEKNLLELISDLDLIKKLYSLELTRDEWERADYRRRWINPKVMNERLQHLFQSADAQTSAAGLTKDHLMDLFDQAFLFYSLAASREMMFHRRITDELSARKLHSAILITGGFHAEGLISMFRQDRVNYGVLMPRVGSELDSHAVYVGNMMNLEPKLFKISTIEKINLLQSPEAIQSLDGDLINIGKAIVESYLAVAKFRNLQELREGVAVFNAAWPNLQLVSTGQSDRLQIRIGGKLLVKNGHYVEIPISNEIIQGASEPVLIAQHLSAGEAAIPDDATAALPDNSRITTDDVSGLIQRLGIEPVSASRPVRVDDKAAAKEPVVSLDEYRDGPRIHFDPKIDASGKSNQDFITLLLGGFLPPADITREKLSRLIESIRSRVIAPALKSFSDGLSSLGWTLDSQARLAIVKALLPTQEELNWLALMLAACPNLKIDLIVTGAVSRSEARILMDQAVDSTRRNLGSDIRPQLKLVVSGNAVKTRLLLQNMALPRAKAAGAEADALNRVILFEDDTIRLTQDGVLAEPELMQRVTFVEGVNIGNSTDRVGVLTAQRFTSALLALFGRLSERVIKALEKTTNGYRVNLSALQAVVERISHDIREALRIQASA